MVGVMMTHEMSRLDFTRMLEDNYPALFDDDNDIGFRIIKGYETVPDFIAAHNIQPTTEHYTSYKDVWNYIVANEHMHDWWLL